MRKFKAKTCVSGVMPPKLLEIRSKDPLLLKAGLGFFLIHNYLFTYLRKGRQRHGRTRGYDQFLLDKVQQQRVSCAKCKDIDGTGSPVRELVWP